MYIKNLLKHIGNTHDERAAENLTVQTTLHGKLVRLPFASLKEALLGKHYILSIVFIGDALSRRFNRTYRGKNAPANVLGFPLSKTEGELFINPHQAKRDAPSFGLPAQKFLLLLVIHGMLHLKGYAHGRTMSAQEQRCMKKFAGMRVREHNKKRRAHAKCKIEISKIKMIIKNAKRIRGNALRLIFLPL